MNNLNCVTGVMGNLDKSQSHKFDWYSSGAHVLSLMAMMTKSCLYYR